MFDIWLLLHGPVWNFRLIDWGFLWGGQKTTKDSLFNWSHWFTLCNSSFNLNSREFKFLSCKKMLVSSTKRLKASTLVHLWRSFTYIKNNKGPKMEVCGTSHRICFESESMVPRETKILVLDKEEENHLYVTPWYRSIPICQARWDGQQYQRPYINQ